MPNISTLSTYKVVFIGFLPFLTAVIFGIMAKSTNSPEVLLGRRLHTLRNAKGWTQQELGNQADVNYKFLGEIERGRQNPSFNVLVKVAGALGVELPELFRFEQEILDRKKVESRIREIIKALPDDAVRQILLLLRTLHPIG